MFSILGGIMGVFFDSIATSNRKKALDAGKLSKGMFKLFAHFFGFISITILISIFGYEMELLTNFKILFLIFILVGFGAISTFLHLHILKNSKLSDLLPYDNLDKLFIILIGFFIFTGTSLITFLISIFTLIVILVFTIDLKNFKVPNNFGLFLIYKVLKAGTVLATGYILVNYSSITFLVTNWAFELLIFLSVALIIKDNFKTLLTQSKQFYKNRLLATLFGRTAWIISLYIIKESGVIIATLLGFLGIASSIISMKFILNDNPTKKQAILAFIVILLIGIGYFFNT